MTAINRSWRRSGALIAVATVGVLGAGGVTAGPAMAHTPVWSVTCTEVKVDLTKYTTKADNTVNITVDGKDLLPTETFKGEFHKKLELPQHDKELTVHLIVKAGDGDQFSRDLTETAPVCEGTTPSPTPPTSPPVTPSPSDTPSTTAPTPSSTPSTPSTPGTSTSTSAAVPPPAEPSANSGDGDLAETGSSSSTPLIGGAGALVILAGGGIVWAARKRRSA
ncbi:LAETG motif-containing sortase-dependent surface protein [Streptomyces sp. NPDC052236]|uniref:LAETG motif-containing sortase-dependent surface protein n=1 Tax=Streptomyces sp. NPDC052236 TaxID=3365686 RepID=UPI0037D47F2F